MKSPLSVPFFKQDTDYSCGPTSLQMVFRYFGVVKSEKSLVEEADADRESGTRHEKMIEIARKNGFYCYVNENSSIEELSYYLQLGLPPIVHFLEPSSDDSHYSVVIGIKEGKILLNDPWNGKDLRLGIHDFETRWNGGDLGSNRWTMILSDEDFCLGKTYKPSV